MAERQAAYYSQDACADTLEVMNKRLSQDLRNRVRRIAMCPPNSAEWREVADTITHLAQVASMEAKDVKDRNGSIWERDEMCVRCIIEESKSNVLLRMMIDFKNYMYEQEQNGVLPADSDSYCLKLFEASMGELLKNLFTAVESLQTLDIPALLTYAEKVLTVANANISDDPTTQEIVIVQYLHLLLAQVERVEEDKVISLLLDHSIIPAVLQHFANYRATAGEEGVQTYVWLMTFLADSEYFQTHRKEFLPSSEDARLLQNLEEPAKSMKSAENDADKRRKLRALCDLIVRYK